jgi:hypothetical protein
MWSVAVETIILGELIELSSRQDALLGPILLRMDR